MTRHCPHCGNALAADANPRRRFCSDRCRYRHRDTNRTPEALAADAERHRRRYANDPDHRAEKSSSDAQRYATDPAYRDRKRAASRRWYQHRQHPTEGTARP